ncbi:MAG TPA: peptidoglycan-binding domain-containing protein [Terriglobales bacterium]|nr:peptidoglycan-binding domain-containing protein [Terriglobales bacterium]
MFRFDQIRRWGRVELCSLLCVVAHGLALAQTATPPPPTPTQPAPATAAPATTAPATAPAANAEHPASAHATTNRTSAHNSAQKKKSSHGKKGSTKRGQKAIDATRAREIQTALIREHYMQGQPSGTWDGATQTAMQRYQADHGWQSKMTPDARALIKLGLGPSHDHLLNPESAMTTPTPTPTASAASDPKTAAKPAPAADSVPKQ